MALQSVGLAVGAREWVYLLGPSASGKTTLLRTIAGLEPLAGGSIRLDGQLASNDRLVLAPHQRAIGFLFQEPSLWPHLSATANVALGIVGGERSAEARRWLERLGVGDLAKRFPSALSGGEARRVTLAPPR